MKGNKFSSIQGKKKRKIPGIRVSFSISLNVRRQWNNIYRILWERGCDQEIYTQISNLPRKKPKENKTQVFMNSENVLLLK